MVRDNESRHFGIGPANIHIRNNIVTNNSNTGAIRVYSGTSAGDPMDIRIYGNLVYNSTASGGFLIDQDLKNSISLVMYNNTFYNAPVIVDNSAAAFTAFEFKNNIVYHPGGTPITGANRFTSASNNLTTNPSFKNAANLPTGFTGTFAVNAAPNADGLSLQSTSAAINAGVALSSAYGSSINSLTRPQGAQWDIGAYEFAGIVTPVDTTPPSIPTGLIASAASTTQINLAWSAATDNVAVTGYRISRGGVQIATVTGNTFQNTGLTANTTYSYTVKAVDAAGNASASSATVSATTAGVSQLGGGTSLFTTQTPALLHNTDGAGVNYELGMRFTSTTAGHITAIRFWKDSSETGTHTGRIWSASGVLLASAVFSGETASGWQRRTLALPLAIAASTEYVVSVNTGNTYYVTTNSGLATAVTNGSLRSIVGSNGRLGAPGQFPTQSWQASNYFRDVEFTASVTTPPTSLTYTASTDFSGTQGYRQWSYRDSTGALLVYDPVNGRWKGVEAYLWIWAGGCHPGSTRNVVRRWTAPQAGSIAISGNVRDLDANGGGGVIAIIRKNGNEIWRTTIVNGDSTGVNFSLARSVAANDRIDFVVNRNGNYNNDSTAFDPTIVLTAVAAPIGSG
jgi:hypothetical protein